MYRYGDILGFSCHRGYKFRGNHNLLTEFKLQCSTNGTWTSSVPDCISRTCPWPDRVADARIFFRKRDNTTVEIPVEGVTMEPDRREMGRNESDPANEISPETFISGTEIIVVCEPGYDLIGDRVRTCTEEERWSSTLASCEPRNCSVAGHPIFKFFKRSGNETVLENGDADVTSLEKWYSRENVTHVYENFEIFVEGSGYRRRIVLTCRNGVQMNLAGLIANETISNITWTCNEIAKWEVSNLSLEEPMLEQVLNNSTDICDRSCAPPQVSSPKTDVDIDKKE